MHTLGDLGRAIRGLDQDIAAFGTEGGGNSLGQGVDTLEELGAGLDAELEVLSLLEWTWMAGLTHLVSKTLLLQVEAGDPGERGTLGSGQERSPGGEGTLHDEE